MRSLPASLSGVIVPMILLSAGLPIVSFANSISVGYQSADYVLELEENDPDIRLTGLILAASLDVTEALSVYAEVTELSNDKQLQQNMQAELETQNWALSTSYSWENSYASLRYSDVQQQEDKLEVGREIALESQQSDYQILSLNFGYDLTLNHWQFGAGVGLHISEWTQTAMRRPAIENPIDFIDEDGDSTFISLSMDASRYHALSSSTDLIWGAGLTWNELINDDLTQSIAATGRDNSPNRPGPNNSSIATGSESYAQINTYLAVFFGDHWQLDVSASLDTESEQDGQFWSINLGYSF